MYLHDLIYFVCWVHYFTLTKRTNIVFFISFNLNLRYLNFLSNKHNFDLDQKVTFFFFLQRSYIPRNLSWAGQDSMVSLLLGRQVQRLFKER